MKPNREEFPATPPRAPKKRGNSAARSEPTIEIYPVPDDISTSGNIVKRKGKDGKPTHRELENADRIRKRTGESVILVPKNAQLKKLGLPPD